MHRWIIENGIYMCSKCPFYYMLRLTWTSLLALSSFSPLSKYFTIILSIGPNHDNCN